MADEQLFRVRNGFVERATKALILQLLDDLLEDRVLNNGEKDAVIEENMATADKTRCLIDKVRLKGPNASQQLIFRLKERDPNLYEQLGLPEV